ncbi:MAG: phytoene/squalene synthase family protein [Bacilli bacterium]
MEKYLIEAYNRCEEVIKKNSETFYAAFRLLSKEKRRAVYAVYAFCRTVDDIVDEGHDIEAQLDQFEKQFVTHIVQSQPSTHFLWTALQHTFRTYTLPITPFLHMIEGQRMDIVKNRYENMEEVLHYSFHVASSVGLMLSPILAPERVHELRVGAIALGQGMQLTNILRDIGEDLERNRIYLPKEEMEKYGISEHSLRSGKVTPEFIALWEEIAKQSELLYEKFFATFHLYPMQARVAVGGAAVLYRDILHSVRKAGYTVFTTKHYVPTERKRELIASLER